MNTSTTNPKVGAASSSGLRRLNSIIGPNGLIPVSRSTWYAGVKSGRFPAPVKLGRISAWRCADIQHLIDNGIGSSTASRTPAAGIRRAITERS